MVDSSEWVVLFECTSLVPDNVNEKKSIDGGAVPARWRERPVRGCTNGKVIEIDGEMDHTAVQVTDQAAVTFERILGDMCGFDSGRHFYTGPITLDVLEFVH